MQGKSIKYFLTIFLILLYPQFSYGTNYTDITSANLPAINDFSSGAVALDVEKDGDLDIFVANKGQNRLLINNASGVFSDVYPTNLPPDNDYSYGVAAGDVNGDGNVDIFVANAGDFNDGQNRLLLNDGTGKFTDATSTWLSGQEPQFYSSGAFGDIDGDDKLDLVVSSSVNISARAIKIFRNNNNTNFVDETSTRLTDSTSAITQKVILADFDRDGDLDILAVNSLNNPNKLLINNGTGYFTENATGVIPSDSDSSNSAAIADIDSDGKTDYIFIANDGGQQNRLYVYNSSPKKFEDKTATNLPVDTDNSFDAAFGDLDGDGDLDIVIANGKDSGQANKVYLNDGTGKFTLADASFFPRGTDFSTAVLINNFDSITGNEVFIANVFNQQNKLYVLAFCYGDVSGNGTISSFDAALIVQYSVDLIPSFPVGAPVCTP